MMRQSTLVMFSGGREVGRTMAVCRHIGEPDDGPMLNARR